MQIIKIYLRAWDSWGKKYLFKRIYEINVRSCTFNFDHTWSLRVYFNILQLKLKDKGV